MNEIRDYIQSHINQFHERRAESLRKLKLIQILKRKNPYLFRAKNINTFHELVKHLLDAHLSSQEETIFGEFLENLAVFVCSQTYQGRKSSAEGIDLEFSKDGTHYLVSIKSGPNWGNSSQVKKMVENFKKAQRILRSNNPGIHIQAVNGCCYGKDANPDKGDYLKLCGQAFWEFISGNTRLYIDLIEPLGWQAKQKNDEFYQEYDRILNQFTIEFANQFSLDGKIDWEKLVKINSGKESL
ncbi:MAG: PmeII family type II restriction endonuclease [Chloroflexota bacterium]|nr:PmeII family type II restriction endonuclease [Bellilinea sp.]